MRTLPYFRMISYLFEFIPGISIYSPNYSLGLTNLQKLPLFLILDLFLSYTKIYETCNVIRLCTLLKLVAKRRRISYLEEVIKHNAYSIKAVRHIKRNINRKMSGEMWNLRWEWKKVMKKHCFFTTFS